MSTASYCYKPRDEFLADMRSILTEFVDDDYPDTEIVLTLSDFAELLIIIDTQAWRIDELEKLTAAK